jgi:non-heme chloroperoxidase
MFRIFLCCLLALYISPGKLHAEPNAPQEISEPSNQPTDGMIQGAGGVPISVQEWGNPEGPPILLIHGFAFSSVVWKNQIGELAKSARIVSMDLRGHGFSGKPWETEDYSGRKVWADDVAAVIEAKELDRPVIVGWSFGGNVALNYLRVYGADKSRGLVLSGTLAGLVDSPPPPNPNEFGMPEQQGDSRVDNYHSFFDNIEWTARVMSMKKPDSRELLQKQLSLAMTPPYVRRAMNGLELDNRDFAGQLDLPVLMIFGSRDGSVPASYVERAVEVLPQARSICYAGIGHSAFSERPARFNADLLAFVNETTGSGVQTHR